MNCHKTNKFLCGLVITLVVYPVLALSQAFATYTSSTITPATGTIYSTNTPISVNVNSGADNFGGVDVIVTFTGNISYVSAVQNSICSSFTVTPSGNTLDVECFYLGDARTYSGSIGTLYFKSTGTGNATVTITSTDPAVTTKANGAYTLATGALPTAGILDGMNKSLIIGITMIILGGIVLGFSPLVGKIVTGRLRSRKNTLEEKF